MLGTEGDVYSQETLWGSGLDDEVSTSRDARQRAPILVYLGGEGAV